MRLLPPALVLLLASIGQAASPARGLAVHLDAGSQELEGPVRLGMVSEAGEASEISLSDDGQPPDVVAGDGIWSGSGVIPGTSQIITLTAGNWSATSASIPLGSAKERNLELALEGEQVVLGQAKILPTTPGGASMVASPPPGKAAQPSDLPIYVAFALGGILLAVLGYFGAARLPGGRSSGGLPVGVRRSPEPGLFGPGTPALLPGLSQWVVSEADEAQLLHFLVAHIARWRPVLVRRPAPAVLPAVQGGPVFCSEHVNLGAFGHAVHRMQDRWPGLVVIVTGLAPGELLDWTDDLKGGAPVFALIRTAEAAEGPVFDCRREDAGWILRGEAGALRVELPTTLP